MQVYAIVVISIMPRGRLQKRTLHPWTSIADQPLKEERQSFVLYVYFTVPPYLPEAANPDETVNGLS